MQFYDNQLSGPVPARLGGLTKLEVLELGGNQLSGSIPAALCSFVVSINPQRGGLILPYAVSSGKLGNDRAVLMEFYEATGGVNWAVNTNWNTDASLDQWYGVSTDPASRVTSLELGDNQLSGSIPAWLGCLTKLKILELGGNQLFGSIPSSLSHLTNLEVLELGWNQLSGSIPAWLGYLTKLKILELGGNHLSGSIPSSLGDLTNLESLHLDHNQLTGPIPSSLGDLTNLTWLYLAGNQLSGFIPVALRRFSINPQQGGATLACEVVELCREGRRNQ